MKSNREHFAAICLTGVIILVIFPYIFLDHTKPLTYEDFFKSIPTIIIGLITAYIGWQQHQTASAQKNITEDKHRLELFEKRLETYNLFLNISVISHKLSENNEDQEQNLKNSEYIKKIKENEDKLISLGEASLFLFGIEVKEALSNARQNIFSKINFIAKLNDLNTQKYSTQSSWKSEIFRCDEFLKKFYENELSEKMAPYLKIVPYLSMD